jgi:hypothetical protein
MRADFVIRLNIWPWAFGAGRTGATRWVDVGPLGMGFRFEGRCHDR